MGDILNKLKGDDRRSIGKSNEVVNDVLKDPNLFDTLFYGMLHKDPVVRMRSADAVEKVTFKHPEYLNSYKIVLIEQVAAFDQQEIRWHFAQLIPRIELDHEEQKRVLQILIAYLKDKSKIVQTFAMQALADLAMKNPDHKSWVVKLIEDQIVSGSAAVKNRGQKLLKLLQS
jgi:hypothetical protein